MVGSNTKNCCRDKASPTLQVHNMKSYFPLVSYIPNNSQVFLALSLYSVLIVLYIEFSKANFDLKNLNLEGPTGPTHILCRSLQCWQGY